MSNSEIIEKSYLQAVKGIKEEWFFNSNTYWYDYIVLLPGHLKTTYLIVILHNQVLNGGFHQYFVNGYGQFARMTIDALMKIGAVQKSNLLKMALKLVNADYDKDDIFRKKILDRKIDSLFVSDELFAPLDKLDNEYYANNEQIEILLADYLRGFHS